MQHLKMPTVNPKPIRMSHAHADQGPSPVEPSTETTRRGSEVFAEFEWNAIAAALKVSQREFQILRFVFDDQTKTEIAEKLGISAHTVHTYLGRLYRKLGVSSREQLIVYVLGEYLKLFRPRG